jgi:Domain of Unknown Function (DUF1080)
MKTTLLLTTLLTATVVANDLGYTDTPLIPGTKWHVHDSGRPQPTVITPGAPSTQEKVGTAPSDAVALFGGTDLSKWKSGNAEAKWKVENGEMVVSGGGDLQTKDEFGPDFQLHLEWTAPVPAKGKGQGRSNSGVFLFGRYEIQILDNYENQTYPDGQATAIYAYMPPQVNASRKPGEWQTYDIIFEAPRFKEGKLEKPAVVTVLHNGIVTQNHTVLIGVTPHRAVGTYQVHGEKGPIRLQDHGNPVRFRNIWIREMKMPSPEDVGSGPVLGK